MPGLEQAASNTDNTLMGGVWGPEQIQVLVRAPRQLKTQSAFLAVLLSSPLSWQRATASSSAALCSDHPSSLFRRKIHAVTPCAQLLPLSEHIQAHPALSVQQLLAPVGLQLNLSPSTPKGTNCSKLSTCPDTAATPSTHQAPARDGSGSSHRQGRRQKAAASHLGGGTRC